MLNIPQHQANTEPGIIFVNAAGNNEVAQDAQPSYRNRAYEKYLEMHAIGMQHPNADAERAFSCIISGNFFLEPVITHEGHTYEKAAIEEWISRSGNDPVTRSPLTKTQLRPNIAMARLTNQFIEINAVLRAESRGFIRDPRTMDQVINDFKEKLTTISSRTALAATLPAVLMVAGSLEYRKGNITHGTSLVGSGTSLGYSYVTHAGLFSTVGGGTAAAASLAVGGAACADASRVYSQPAAEPSNPASCARS